MDTKNGTFDVMVKGEKKGTAFDINPVEITTDEKCKSQLEFLKSKLTLSDAQSTLFDLCIDVVSAKVGDDLSFGPGEIVELSEFAQANPEFAPEIMACVQHLNESVDCMGDLPPNVFLDAALAYGGLSNVMCAAMKAGPISCDTEVPDEELDEEISDEE